VHSPDDPYVEAVWLPVLGPASFVVWRYLARLAHRSPPPTVSVAGLSAAVGLGPPQAHQSPINRALRRLARFGLVHVDADRITVQAALPFVSSRQLARLDPAIQAMHRAYRDGVVRSAS
jgi:hypothetical protein